MEQRIDHERGRIHEQGVSIGRGVRDGDCADDRAATRTIVNDDRVSDMLAEGACEYSAERTVPPPGG
jgi:hypothetical protein